MPKEEWGNKHFCQCGVRFYGLCREKVVCPACGKRIDLPDGNSANSGGSRSGESDARIRISISAELERG